MTRKLKEEEEKELLWAVSSCQASKMTVASCSPSNILALSSTFLQHFRSGRDPAAAAAQSCFPVWQGFVPSPERVPALQEQTPPPACSWPGQPWPQRDAPSGTSKILKVGPEEKLETAGPNHHQRQDGSSTLLHARSVFGHIWGSARTQPPGNLPGTAIFVFIKTLACCSQQVPMDKALEAPSGSHRIPWEEQQTDGNLLQCFVHPDKWNGFLGAGSSWFNISAWCR